MSAARRSTTLCSSRACGSARSTSVVIAAVTSSPRWAATRVATRSADSGTPAIASPAITRAARRGVAWGRSACTPRLARRPRTRASVGPRPQSSSERSTTGPSTSRSKPIGLSNRSSSGPSATMGSGSVSVERVGGHLVGRLLGQDEAALADVVGPDRLPAELGDDAVHGHRRVEPEHGEPAAVDGPGPDHGQRRPLRTRGQRERRAALVEPDRQRPRAHPLRDAQRAELAAVADRDGDAVVLPGLDLAVRPDDDVGLRGLLDEAVERGTGTHQAVVSCSSSRRVSGRGSSCIHCFVT